MADDHAGSGDDGSDYRPNLGPPLPGNSQPEPVSGGPVPPPPPAPPAYQPPQYGPGSNTAQDPKAVGALVTGVLSLIFILFCGILSIPLGIAAIVLGVQARGRTRAAGTSSTMATAGLVLGAVSLVVMVVGGVVFAVMSSGS